MDTSKGGNLVGAMGDVFGAEKAKEREAKQRAADLARERASREAQKEASTTDWKKYHEAWQKYYQKYYGDYYLKAAKEYVAKESERIADSSRAENEKLRAELEAAKKSSKKQKTSWTKADGRSFKEKVQDLASEGREKREKRRKFIPFIAGAAVMLFILFLQYNRLIFAPIYAYVSPGEAPAAEISEVDPTVTVTKVSGENRLIIPKLNIDVPVIFGSEESDIMTAMNMGVSHYRLVGASAYPGEKGNFVVIGHSAGDIYSSNQYKFIFSGLTRLEEGDLIYMHYNGVRYTYRMYGSEVINPDEAEKIVVENDKPMITLITCYPLGTSRQRLLIRAEQISPNPDEAGETNNEPIVDETNIKIPENEETLFEKLWKSLKP